MRYRDTKTGKFVNAATWRRSRAHGGTRYKRVGRAPARRRRTRAPAMSLAAPPQVEGGRAPGGGGGTRTAGIITGPIPAEFLEYGDDYFEGFEEFAEEDEY